MDLREKKTRRSITNAFLQLRRSKPLERITVKELAELAEVSKATFYLHYRDIYDLSDTLQEEVIQNILSSITKPQNMFLDETAFAFEMFHGFHAQQSLVDILFAGTQASVLPMRIEKELLDFAHKLLPDADPGMDMMLTYQIQGSYYVYQKYHKEYGMDEMIRFAGEASRAISGNFSL